MRFITLPRDALLAPLQVVSSIVEKRHTMPILSNVLIEKEGEQLTLLATDVDIQVRTSTHAGLDGGEGGAITVGARKLQDILRALPARDVAFDVDDGRLTVRAGKSRFALQTLPADDYPRLKTPEITGARLQLTQKAFRAKLARVQYAMANQDIRFYLNGLLLVVQDNELRFVATDGHRLAFDATTLGEPAADAPAPASSVPGAPRTEVILPRKTVTELSRLLADNDDPLEILLADNQAVFRFGAIELITKLIDGKYPDYERVIPSALDKTVRFERAVLLESLQRAAILTNDKFRGVRLLLGDGLLKLSSVNSEQEEANEELEIDYAQEAIDTGFNVSYLVEVLGNLDAEHIDWHFRDGGSSSMITLPGDDHFKYVVMPMRI